MARLRASLSFANVTSALALFVALGGSAYAVATGSIGSRELRNNSVQGKDVRNRTLSSRDVKRNSLGGAAVSESRLGTVPRASSVGGLGIDRLLLRCPRGTKAISGTCLELTVRVPQAYGGARIACEADNRRLPDYSELAGLIDDSDVPVPPGGELTANAYPSESDPGRVDALVITSDTGAVALTPDTFPGRKHFRCAANPTNG